MWLPSQSVRSAQWHLVWLRMFRICMGFVSIIPGATGQIHVKIISKNIPCLHQSVRDWVSAAMKNNKLDLVDHHLASNGECFLGVLLGHQHGYVLIPGQSQNTLHKRKISVQYVIMMNPLKWYIGCHLEKWQMVKALQYRQLWCSISRLIALKLTLGQSHLKI